LSLVKKISPALSLKIKGLDVCSNSLGSGLIVWGSLMSRIAAKTLNKSFVFTFFGSYLLI